MHFFEALKDPLPIHGDPLRRPLLLLRIECWFRLVGAVFLLLMIPFAYILLDFMADQMANEDPEFFDTFIKIMEVAIYFVIVLSLLFWLAFHLWLNWVAQQIKERKFGAKGALFGYSLTVVILTGLGLLSTLFQTIQMMTFNGEAMLSISGNLIGLPHSIALLVFGILNASSSQQQEFADALEEPPAARPWGTV